MLITEQGPGRRPQPEGAVRPGRHARPAPDRTRPLVAAGVVLLLWFAWLLVPDAGSGSATGDLGAAADAAVEPDGAGDAGGPANPLAVPSGEPADAGSGPGPADRATAAATEGAGSAGPDAATDAATPGSPTPSRPAGADSQAAPVPVEVPQRGSGDFAVAPGEGERFGREGDLVRYSVEVEGGVPLDAAEVAAVVDGVLADPRSWTGDGRWSLQRTDDDPDVRIRVSSPDTTDALCAPLRTNGEVSCRNGDDVVLNALRWTRGARSWGDDVVGYREYLVNHELGHYLGHGHVPCPGEGEPAPVMLQQTIGLQGCAPNGWPFP